MYRLRRPRRWIDALGFVLALWSCGALAGPDDAPELVFLNWSDYMDPDLVSEFEDLTGARVKSLYFDSDTQRDEMVLAAEGTGFDVVVINGATLTAWGEHGWLAPVSESEVPNLRHIDPRWREAFRLADRNGVPYFWGTVGIGYRRDLVPEPMTSWNQLYRPAPELRGKITMMRDGPDLIGMALKALGHSANSTSIDELGEAEVLLQAQKPYVRAYQYSAVNEGAGLVTGEIAATMLFNGDALLLKAYNENIDFLLPKEGGNLWVDYLVVLKAARQPGLAWRFIDFLSEPRNAARLAKTLHYATPNRAAEGYLPESYFGDPIIYPSGPALEHSEFYKELPPRVVKLRNAITDRILQ